MPLSNTTIRQQKEKDMKGWEANRDLYLDKDGKVVEDGDPDTAFLLARKGRVIPDVQMEQYGVKKKAPTEVDRTPEQVEEKEPKAESKAKPKAKDKAVKKKGDKSG